MLGYMQEEIRLVLKIRESTDQSVRSANIQIRTGHKPKAHVEVNKAISTKKLLAELRKSRKSRPWGWSGSEVLVQGQQEREEGVGQR